VLGIPYPHSSISTSTVLHPPILIRVKCVMCVHGGGDRRAAMYDVRTCAHSQYSNGDACTYVAAAAL
jgi:hypothetical protein